MVTFSDPGASEAVVIPAGSFALVTGRERAAAALRNVRESLAPAGRLIVDVEPPQLPAGPAHPADGSRAWTFEATRG